MKEPKEYIACFVDNKVILCGFHNGKRAYEFPLDTDEDRLHFHSVLSDWKKRSYAEVRGITLH